MAYEKRNISFLMTTIIIVVLAVVAIFGGCCKMVDSGYTGLRLMFGKVVSEPLGPGLWFYSPIGGSIVTYDCREQRWDERMESYTKDVQQATLSVTVTYTLDSARIIELHNGIGRNYEQKILYPAIVGVTKDVIGQWEADKLISSREQATKEIYDQVTKVLADKPVRVTSVILANIDYSDTFEKAIEDKQVAMQNAIRAKNQTQEIEEEARQKVITAEAEAKAMQVRGEALKENPGLVQLQAIEKWDGRAPNTLVIGGDAQTLIGTQVPVK